MVLKHDNWDKRIQIFDELAQEYDKWFDENRFVYESEVLALRKFLPKKGKGLEVGVGSGRFALPLGIKLGVEPAEAMSGIARKRGIEVVKAKAEDLPFDDASFDFVLMVTTICFLRNPIKGLQEAKRVLKSRGYMIIGMIDKKSTVGRIYESKKNKSKFHRYARFYSVNEVVEWLRRMEHKNIKLRQTILKNPEKIRAIEPIKEGYGEGGFIVISSQKEK
ncbi:MAG: class I SAM-dependent methyltransferase [Candidatus Dadabacteria bacterium]|nr:class I SAM-dependent methyltransferase [Candidatus Dadabacteria bacterium]